jgi:2-keto-4-pentenoate hydratase/2-oxohepta-3-ene-1,7-dioic acid hydratase in catechol pathway
LVNLAKSLLTIEEGKDYHISGDSLLSIPQKEALMKLVRFKWQGKIVNGVLDGQEVRSISGNVFDKFKVGGSLGKLNDFRLLPPIDPNNLMAIGLNYIDVMERWVKETGRPKPIRPHVFPLIRSSMIGHLDNIVYPTIAHDNWAYPELVVVMKRAAKLVKEDEAADYILGYTCGNDMAALDIEFGQDDGLTGRAHNFDTFTSFGPCIETELPPDNIGISLKFNGELVVGGNTRNMAFGIGKIVSHVSEFMTLQPGDVIFTGSPGGHPFKVGDDIEVEIEGIGTLRNRVVT